MNWRRFFGLSEDLNRADTRPRRRTASRSFVRPLELLEGRELLDAGMSPSSLPPVESPAAMVESAPARSVYTADSAIASNFNGTAIAAGNFVWFNSVVKVSGRGTIPAQLDFVNVQIQFRANGIDHVLTVPNSTILFSSTTTVASTVFDSTSSSWITTVPAGYTGNVFLSGFALPVSEPGLPGGIKSVKWSGTFSSEAPNLKASWKWSAAVYSQFGDHSTLDVKPVDGDRLSPYRNSDHAGTVQTFKKKVLGGARGGGGSNYTGSYSGTASVALSNQTTFVEPVPQYEWPGFE